MLINLKRTNIELFAKTPSLFVSLLSLHYASLPKPQTHDPPKPLSKPHLETLVHKRYSNGKFSDLVRQVVALPSVLFTACQNLTTKNDPETVSLAAISKRLSIDELGREIFEDRFDIKACCVKILSSDPKGEFLILPNLKLKVLIEAIRMVLEIVYDGRFATFSFGGRVGVGRHTAIRYLKNSVENPSWWFSVVFDHGKFDNGNVDKLCSFIGDKIRDGVLVDMIKKLFECEVVGIQFGGGYFGRGFPQESRLSPILINIYFDWFDREVQAMRLRRNIENARYEPNEVVPEIDVYFKPAKIYAVRYSDEILVITSGSKKWTRDLKNWAVEYFENKLGLKVDKEKTVIHSSVSEKITFMGMELQAVKPSVLRPPMSEKAIRARKKFLRQKEVQAQELRNARERNRKNLGLKILNHLFKKLKSSVDCPKNELRIEDKVREIFGTWGHEVAGEYLRSLDDREAWHRSLTSGYFLSLRHIREKLPPEVVDSYDKFQEQVDKHLNPARARKALEAEERRKEEEEEQRYSKATVNDLTKLCMRVEAPIELVRKAVRLVGFTNEMGRPRPIGLLVALEDADIIKWYAGVGRRWLAFYCCCHNFRAVKTVVTYHLRFSCILTLAEKHESTKLRTIKQYTKDLAIFDPDGKYAEVHFPTEREVKRLGDQNLSDPKPVDGALSLVMVRLASDEPPYVCIAHFCERTDTTVYRLRLLQKRLGVSPSDDEKWVKGIGAIHDSFHRKCLPLCPEHAHDFYLGRITLQHIDCSLSMDME